MFLFCIDIFFKVEISYNCITHLINLFIYFHIFILLFLFHYCFFCVCVQTINIHSWRIS